MMKEEFKPYVPANKLTSEFTFTSIIMGAILAVVFGAANAYLGLRVGMTVSASIPAAVISMAVIRVILKKDSILESNMVQTIGSAGESLAAGAIFTLPVLYLWAAEGIMSAPGLLEITIIALCGGVLGVLFMVPLRKALIVREHGILPYPEGTACAKVLLAGEERGQAAGKVFAGIGVSAVIKFIIDGLKVTAGVIKIPLNTLKTEFALEVYPALISVGYICGAGISSYIFAGGILGWLVIIPIIANMNSGLANEPGVIWNTYIRYIGAGAVAAGGIISLIRSIPLIITTFRDSVISMRKSESNSKMRTDKDLSMKLIGIIVVIMILVLWILPQIPVTLPGALMIVVFGFFFATVSSRMVGLVGSSNNPVSGMAIATLLIATSLLKLTGDSGVRGMQGAIAIGSIICIIAAMSGDTSQDLKTGYILGATPWRQQAGELIGAIISALTIGGVLVLLDKAWGFGTPQIAAPQATLMRMIVEGVMGGDLPWTYVLIGVFIAMAIELIGINSLPVAIGLYLPIELSVAIMIGGVVRLVTDRITRGSDNNKDTSGAGILFCSGMIAGEGIVGIILAILAVMGLESLFDISGSINLGIVGAILLLVVIIILLCIISVRREADES